MKGILNNNMIPEVSRDAITAKAPNANTTQAAKDLNEYFVSHLLKTLYSINDNSDVDPAFTGGMGGKIFTDFLLNEYAKALAPKMDISGKVIEKYLDNKISGSDKKNNSVGVAKIKNTEDLTIEYDLDEIDMEI